MKAQSQKDKLLQFIIHWLYSFSPFLSTQPEAGVGPVNAEADREVPHIGERPDGAKGEETI